MQPPISIGTILQNHYRIIQLLGQGGFGRTYLAEDQGRFNERCAIKEFVPVQGEDKFSDKATQLFQREASVLYQINHPQIPKFRATFEEGDRLFLVQDYVEGPTYHEVLNQRRQENRAFSETEVRRFLQQLLPVLAHIHAKGIIHRDISPDNIILRREDQLPVLIDFGVVKEAVTRMQMDGVVSRATTVGKAGYAPIEQMQTGRAYPNSDLYALAVTAIVLLTGKEPQTLFDDVTATWNWQNQALVSPELARVLNKALSYRPGDRFASVKEMAQALQSGQVGANPLPSSQGEAASGVNDRLSGDLNGDLASGLTGAGDLGAAASPPGVSAPRAAGGIPAAQAPPPSQMKTVAVGRPYLDPATQTARAAGSQGTPTVQRPTTVRQENQRLVMPSERERRSMLENPLAVGGLAVGLAALAGFMGYAVVQNLEPGATPSPTVTALPPESTQPPSPTPKPTPTQVPPRPVEYEQPQLQLSPGEPKVLEGSLRRGDTVIYPLVAEAGQSLSVSQFEEGVLLSVIGPDGQPVGDRAERVLRWEGTLETPGEYRIKLSPVRGVSSSNYRLEVTLEASPSPEPSTPPETVPPVPPGETTPPTDVPVAPEVESQRVSFPPGSQGIQVANSVGPGRIRRYLVNAGEGQILKAEIVASDGPVVFDVLMPGGEMMADASGIVMWESFLPVGGDYVIDVQASQASEFTLQIEVVDDGPPAP